MVYEERVERVLRCAVEDYAPVLTVLRPVIQQVWSANLDRHEMRLGDDANTLGYLSYRNIGNLAAPRLRALNGVQASFDTGSLAIQCASRVLHLSKASAQSAGWAPHTMDWADSDVRFDSATKNSKDYRPQEGTLFQAEPADAEALVHLHLVWQGRADGVVRTWIGFPRLGEPSWFALQDLGEVGLSAAGMATPGIPMAPETRAASSFDALEAPEPQVGLRRDPRAGGNDGDRAAGDAARP